MHDYFEDLRYGEIKFTNSKPGSDWNYSNIGSVVAAYIIERTSGVSFADFTQTHIFNPLNLNDSYWSIGESDSMFHQVLRNRTRLQ